MVQLAPVAALVAALLVPALAPPATTAGSAAPAEWVVSLQYRDPLTPAFGAIRVHHDAGYAPPAMWHVIPYESNLAVIGLLRSGHPERLDVAERWIGWTLAHMLPEAAGTPLVPAGAVFDHWYSADGAVETPCLPGPSPAYCMYRDADDSNAATFLSLLRVYADEGGARAAARLSEPDARAAVRTLVALIESLMDADDLTYARPEWPQKYTMDNAEVACGLRGAEVVARGAQADAAKADAAAALAARVRGAITRELYDAQSGLFHVAKDSFGSITYADTAKWYAGTVALAWPHLHAVVAPQGAAAAAQMAALNGAWDGDPGADWTTTAVDPDGFLWPSIGHAALVAGDAERAARHAALVASARPTFAYPWTSGDAGWLLMTLSGDLDARGCA